MKKFLLALVIVLDILCAGATLYLLFAGDASGASYLRTIGTAVGPAAASILLAFAVSKLLQRTPAN